MRPVEFSKTLRVWRGAGQGEVAGAALTGGTVHADLPAQFIGDAAHDRQAQPVAFDARLPQLLKGRKEPLLLIGAGPDRFESGHPFAELCQFGDELIGVFS